MTKFTDETNEVKSWISGHWRWLRWPVVFAAGVLVGVLL